MIDLLYNKILFKNGLLSLTIKGLVIFINQFIFQGK